MEENIKKVLKHRTVAMWFNECNNMAFYTLSRNKGATSEHALTSLLGLGTKLFPQNYLVSSKSLE